jgi:MoaA/NifB/PqqE/SkfB family radical SAM enzyme
MSTVTTLAPVTFLELEITGRCQLACTHCYAESGPGGSHGSMTVYDWERVITEARDLGVEAVQFIGGEPTLYPGLGRLVRYALQIGLRVDVYSNLVHVTPELWDLFELPSVSLGTSWYSADPTTHAKITGTVGSYWRTQANIAEALRRGIKVRAGIVDVIDGQDVGGARARLLEMGVTAVSTDRARGVGRAAQSGAASRAELCGRCGDGRAAISGDGDVCPCVLGRFLVAGNVQITPLVEILSGPAWREITGSIPRDSGCVTCTPADSNDCNPSRKPA